MKWTSLCFIIFYWISRGLGVLGFLGYIGFQNQNASFRATCAQKGREEKCWMLWFLLIPWATGPTGVPFQNIFELPVYIFIYIYMNHSYILLIIHIYIYDIWINNHQYILISSPIFSQQPSGGLPGLVHIRVVLQGQASIGGLDLLLWGTCRDRNARDFLKSSIYLSIYIYIYIWIYIYI
jgi:hypothetical protein